MKTGGKYLITQYCPVLSFLGVLPSPGKPGFSHLGFPGRSVLRQPWVIRKDSRGREVVPLHNCHSKEWVFIVVCWCMDLYKVIWVYIPGPVSEYIVAKKSQLDHILSYRTLWDVRQNVSVLRTSTPACWSSGSHYCMMSSPLWPSVLPYVGQPRSYLCWSGYKSSIQGRHTLPGALLLCWKLLGVCFILGLNISSYEVQGPICICDHILCMLVPVQVMTDFQSKLLCMVYCLKNLAM